MITDFGPFAIHPPPLPAIGGTVLTAACPTADGRQRHQLGSGSGALWQWGANARSGRSHDLVGSAKRAADCCVGVLVVNMEGRSSLPRGAPARRRASVSVGRRRAELSNGFDAG